MVAVHCWSERDELVHVCRAICHVFGQPFEFCQGFMDACLQGDPFDFGMAKGFLYLDKQSPGSWVGECH